MARGDQDTARLLHGLFECNVTALVVAGERVAHAWVLSWTSTGGRTAPRELRSGPVDPELVRPLRPGVASARPGGVELSPGPAAVRCELAVPLEVTGGRTVAWFLGRAGRGFTDLEVEHATLLVPGLTLRLARLVATRPLPEPLTDREQGVLELVALGLTSRAVARRFAISERTVQKHLEHVYRKTGCGDRLSDVRRVREAALFST